MTDTELITRLQQQDREAFRILLDKFRDMVYRTSLGIVQNEEDAEDIAQDVFIEVFQSVSSFRGDARLSTWLYRITVNKSLNLIRKNKRRDWMISLESFFRNAKNDDKKSGHIFEPPVDTPLEKAERSRLLEQAISSLPDNQRVAFTLHKIEELPHREIAQVMDTSVSAVESLIFRAKINLQKKLSSYYKL